MPLSRGPTEGDVVRLRVIVHRFDPTSDEPPAWVPYEVPLPSNKTVLDALLYVEEAHDPTLAFRRTCRSGICGACAGTVNGQLGLFCQILLRDAATPSPPSDRRGDIVIGPLPHLPVLKDLVVDVRPFFQDLQDLKTWLEPTPGYNGTIARDVFDKLWGTLGCVLCGICEIPARPPGEHHPAAVARVLRLAHDPRDARGSKRLDALGPVPLDLPARLKALCPKGVDLAPLIGDSD